MMKGILILLATFSLLAAEDQAPAIHSKSYFTEGQYEGKDGTFYYKAQSVEIVALGHSEDKAHAQSNMEQPKPYAERKDFVSNPSFSNSDKQIDKRPYEERKDFVSNDSPFHLYLTGVGEPNQTIEWIMGNKNTDISYAYISNELYLYKTTTYTLALKPKLSGGHSTTATQSYNV